MGSVSFIDGLSEIKSVPIDHSALGDQIIIPAVVGKRLAILGLMITVTALVNVEWRNGIAGPKLTGNSVRNAGEGYVLPVAGHTTYWFVLGTNTPLVLNLSAANNVNGLCTYREIA